MSEFNENNQNDISTESQTVENSVENITNNVSELPSTDPEINGPEIISGAEAVKKSPAKLIAIIAVIIALIFGCCGGAYALIPQVKNKVKMLVNSPEEYFKWVYTQDIENSSIADLLYNEDETSKDMQANLKIDLEKDAIEKLISEQNGGSMEDAGITIPSSVNMDIKSATIDGYQAINADISTDSNHLLTENIYLKDNKYYIQYPEMSSSYLCLDFVYAMKKGLEENDNEQAKEILLPIIENLISDSEKQILTKDEFEELRDKYSEIVINNINNVEMEKNSECEAGGVKCKYTKLIAKFDLGTCYSIVKDILEALENDEIIAKLVEENSSYTKEDFKNTISGLLDQLGGLEISGGNTAFVLNTYVNDKGEIVGASLDNIGFVDETGETGFDSEFSVGLFTTKDGNNYGFSAFAEVDDERYSIDGSAEENSRKLTGDATVSADGENVLGISFEDLECNEDNKFVNGSVTLGLSALGIDDVTIDFENQDNKQTIKSDITYEGTKYASLTYDIIYEQPDSITVFANDAKVYNFDEMEQYYSEDADVQTLLNNICNALGIDPELLNRGNYLMNNTDFSNIDDEDLWDIDDDYLDDDYDIDTESYDPVKYDMSKIKIQFNGSDVKLPGKISDIYDKVKFENDKVAAYNSEYGYSDDYGLLVGVYNETDKEMNIKDCNISYVSVSDGGTDKLTIDGIGIGDDIKKFADKYGCTLSDPSTGYVELEDSGDGYGYIDIYYESGKIYEISVYFG